MEIIAVFFGGCAGLNDIPFRFCVIFFVRIFCSGNIIKCAVYFIVSYEQTVLFFFILHFFFRMCMHVTL